MKNKYLILFLAAIIAGTGFTGCKDGDGDKDYGLGLIYMPQAQRGDYYAVPSGGGEWTYNFEVEDGKLNVFLGVYRGGKFSKNEAFSVDVQTLASEAQSFVTNTALANAEIMPAGYYTLPSKVEVPGGHYQQTFDLSINISDLRNSANDGKNLVLAVGIANPTRYQLAEENTSVIIVVDVDAIRQYL